MGLVPPTRLHEEARDFGWLYLTAGFSSARFFLFVSFVVVIVMVLTTGAPETVCSSN